jgi:hypothetical protein
MSASSSSRWPLDSLSSRSTLSSSSWGWQKCKADAVAHAHWGPAFMRCARAAIPERPAHTRRQERPARTRRQGRELDTQPASKRLTSGAGQSFATCSCRLSEAMDTTSLSRASSSSGRSLSSSSPSSWSSRPWQYKGDVRQAVSRCAIGQRRLQLQALQNAAKEDTQTWPMRLPAGLFYNTLCLQTHLSCDCKVDQVDLCTGLRQVVGVGQPRGQVQPEGLCQRVVGCCQLVGKRKPINACSHLSLQQSRGVICWQRLYTTCKPLTSQPAASPEFRIILNLRIPQVNHGPRACTAKPGCEALVET